MLRAFDDNGFIIITDARSRKVKELVNDFTYDR
jgi:pyridoxine/pyridoxamine 5'-phosphate oxidase